MSLNKEAQDRITTIMEYGTKPMIGRSSKDLFELRANMAAVLLAHNGRGEVAHCVGLADQLLEELVRAEEVEVVENEQ